jgi:hypothetical protein
MLLLKRPPEPSDFAKKVVKSKQAVQQHIDAILKAPTPLATLPPAPLNHPKPKQPKKGKKKEVFPPKWSSFKDAFSKAQHGRCAYCEVSVIGAQHGDVEHYYPKAQVHALYDDPSTWGREKPYLSNVEGRKTRILCDTGYWWLAYEWRNYLLSCLVCNEYWKGALFPIEDEPRKLPPDVGITEASLLLNPFENINPAQHFFFDYFGQIHPVANSRRGYETIRTCGLDRPSLRNIRGGIALEIHDLLNRLSRAGTPGQLKDILYSLYLKGVETSQHPGMVRIIIEQRTDLTWSEIVGQLTHLLISDLRDATAPDEMMDIFYQLYNIGNGSHESAELVQAIVTEQRGQTWERLVGELASSLTTIFNTSTDVGIRTNALRFLHWMGVNDHSYADAIKSIITRRCELSWGEFEAAFVAIAPPAYNKA